MGFVGEVGWVLSKAGQMLRRGSSLGGRILSQFRGGGLAGLPRNASKSPVVRYGSRGLLVVGGGFSLVNNVNEDQSADRAVAETVGEVGFGLAAVKGFTAGGCAAGALAGGVGAPVGCVIGGAVGIGAAIVGSEQAGELAGDAWDGIKSGASAVGRGATRLGRGIADGVGSAADAVGGFVGGLF